MSNQRQPTGTEPSGAQNVWFQESRERMMVEQEKQQKTWELAGAEALTLRNGWKKGDALFPLINALRQANFLPRYLMKEGKILRMLNPTISLTQRGAQRYLQICRWWVKHGQALRQLNQFPLNLNKLTTMHPAFERAQELSKAMLWKGRKDNLMFQYVHLAAICGDRKAVGAAENYFVAATCLIRELPLLQFNVVTTLLRQRNMAKTSSRRSNSWGKSSKFRQRKGKEVKMSKSKDMRRK